jgi:hypothetical protein
MNSPSHREPILPKTVTGATTVKNANARTAVNFFRSVHNNSGNVYNNHNSGSRDSGRGLGGGWNGGSHIVEESPQRERLPSGIHSNAEIPGVSYLKVKVSYL